jgi:hypothetical protein
MEITDLKIFNVDGKKKKNNTAQTAMKLIIQSKKFDYLSIVNNSIQNYNDSKQK